MHPLFHALTNTIVQFIAISGILFVAGWMIGYLARCINSVYQSFVWPRLGLYAFGLVGIPAHEFSHYLFCKLFRLEVTKVKWFDAKGKGGAHGAVTHTYDPGNPLHRFAHLFIGFAPILVLPLIIAALYFWLVPEGQHLFNGFRLPRDLHTLTEFKTLLFLYFGFSLVAHMDLSKEDLEIASSGLPVLFIILLLVNIGALLVGYDPTALLRTFGVQAWKFCGPILAVCFVLAILHLFFAWLVLGLIHFLLRQPPVRVLP